jgi:Na+-transporting methylmalonyl-CoA/oxaloacetate decarboxylase gamma subunit
MDNLGWGLQMTVVGMGLVLGLLAALWGLLVLVMRFDSPKAAAASPADASSAEGDASTEAVAVEGADGMDRDLVAAILVATLAHKAWRRQEAAPLMRSYWPGSLLYASRWVAAGRVRQTNSWRHRRA